MGSKEIENYLKSEDVDIEGFINELLKVEGINRTIIAKIILGVEPNHIIQEMLWDINKENKEDNFIVMIIKFLQL